ncbi:MAG: DUF1501 domain-containing protein [Bauldia sp.]
MQNFYCEPMSPSRRAVMGAAGALFASAFIPKWAVAAASGRDARLVVIVLRGALDGLGAVAPLGDPDYAGLHGDLSLSLSGAKPALPLDSFFAVHPEMPNFARLFKAGQASVVHATATNYRNRSHFDGQDVLESGQPSPGKTQSGWLNRLIGAIPKGDRVAPVGALGVGAIPPLVVRGPAPVLGWAPPTIQPATEDLASRVLAMYGTQDKGLAGALSAGVTTDTMARAQGMGAPQAARGAADPVGMRQAAEGAARLIATPEGPRIAALAFEGWDTHANEGGATGQLANRLGGLDQSIAAFEKILGAAWKDTAVMVVTEFGRTAKVNGTLGTDHGEGTVAFLAGGAIKGGKVIADWPGLSEKALYEGRDLKPTTDLRAVTKGIVSDLFGVSASALGNDVFPDTADLTPTKDLIA